jgi:rhodanese-related sulfurtransferase
MVRQILTMETLLKLALVSLLFTGLSQEVKAVPENDSVKHVKAKEAAIYLKDHPDVVVLDIRTPSEYGKGHLAKAKNINFYDENFKADIGKLDKSKTYLVHCASGGRSGKSLVVFNEGGFKTIIHLDGGYKGWVKQGLPVEK